MRLNHSDFKSVFDYAIHIVRNYGTTVKITIITATEGANAGRTYHVILPYAPLLSYEKPIAKLEPLYTTHGEICGVKRTRIKE